MDTSQPKPSLGVSPNICSTCLRNVRPVRYKGGIRRSIELLCDRTSVPSNERLVREAGVKATVAQRSASWPASTEDSRAGGAVLLRPATRRRGSARDAAGQAPRPPLRLVATDGRVVRPASGEPVRTNQAAPPAPPQPAAAPGPAATRPAAPAAARSAAPGPALTPVRLTRRGRLVVTGMAVLLVAAGSVALAGAAQAIGHSGAQARPGAARRGGDHQGRGPAGAEPVDAGRGVRPERGHPAGHPGDPAAELDEHRPGAARPGPLDAPRLSPKFFCFDGRHRLPSGCGRVYL